MRITLPASENKKRTAGKAGMNHRGTSHARGGGTENTSVARERPRPAIRPLRHGRAPPAGHFSGFSGGDSAEVQRRAALGAFEGLPDVPGDCRWFGADLPGGEAEHDDLVPGHAPAA